MSTTGLKRTPFYDMHVSLGAKMVPFAGFEMPVQYPTGINREHEIVRTEIGVFDVTHMGEFEITGPDRNAFVNRVTCNDVGALTEGQVQYSAILTEDGTFVDDCLVYRFDDKIMMVVNASNCEKDWKHIVDRKGGINVRLKNISDDVALLAVQGPKSEGLMQSLTRLNLTGMGYYHFDVGQVAGTDCFVSRTGYTGEDGFEIYFRPKQAEVMWHAVVGQGRGAPIGLGARDSLRLEAGMPLYGNDIDDTTNPYEAGVGWIVKLNKGAPFVGRPPLEQVKAKGVTRKLVGFRPLEKGVIPRHGYDTYLGERKVDIVRSGGFSPTLKHAIGTTYLPTHSVEPGTRFLIDCRGKKVEAEVVKLPFYRGSVKRK
ncbi:MAG TPA: glycine cleavage system aminomethyltransferase GcvT [Gemmatimonadales bacterium]|jgi:aminomethyltransferase|nr:glycine cleavage system aminomethyltransferase GcvT [Gemmatimonadales bacterium]